MKQTPNNFTPEQETNAARIACEATKNYYLAYELAKNRYYAIFDAAFDCALAAKPDACTPEIIATVRKAAEQAAIRQMSETNERFNQCLTDHSTLTTS